MGWGLGYDTTWERWIGYEVPAYCDAPQCKKEIDRGLAYVCGGEPYGGEKGCGLFFCAEHLSVDALCKRCEKGKKPYKPSREHPDWINHLLIDQTWDLWRRENPDKVQLLKEREVKK